MSKLDEIRNQIAELQKEEKRLEAIYDTDGVFLATFSNCSLYPRVLLKNGEEWKACTPEKGELVHNTTLVTWSDYVITHKLVYIDGEWSLEKVQC